MDISSFDNDTKQLAAKVFIKQFFFTSFLSTSTIDSISLTLVSKVLWESSRLALRLFSDSSVSQIHLELASIFKNQSSNFRGFTELC